MPPANRTYPVVGEHFQGVLDALETGISGDPNASFPVGEWKRPEDLDSRFEEPPYALLRLFPSAGEFDGPLSDTESDILLRIQIVGVGFTHRQALDVTDVCRKFMQASLVTIPNRYVQSLSLMVTSGGVSRDDDLLIPFQESSDIYELMTTPA